MHLYRKANFMHRSASPRPRIYRGASSHLVQRRVPDRVTCSRMQFSAKQIILVRLGESFFTLHSAHFCNSIRAAAAATARPTDYMTQEPFDLSLSLSALSVIYLKIFTAEFFLFSPVYRGRPGESLFRGSLDLSSFFPVLFCHSGYWISSFFSVRILFGSTGGTYRWGWNGVKIDLNL